MDIIDHSSCSRLLGHDCHLGNRHDDAGHNHQHFYPDQHDISSTVDTGCRHFHDRSDNYSDPPGSNLGLTTLG